MKNRLKTGDVLVCLRRFILYKCNIFAVLACGLHAVSAQDGSPKEQATVNSSQQSTQKSDRSGLTMSLSQALWASLAFEDKEQIAELLQSGADANAVEEISLMTPLMVSERGEVAKLLLDAGADPNSKDKLGRTVSHHAVKMSEAATVVRLLGEAGADIDVPAAGIANMTPLLCAIEYYIEDHVRDETALVIRMLAHLGADLEAVDSAGRSALAIAAAFNQPALIQLLIDLGADPQRATADGRTPLDYAREAKAEQAIRILASNPSKSLKAN